MKRLLLLALILPFLATLLQAQAAQEINSKNELRELSATIQAELELHGDRILGHELNYHWSTRLEQITDCRAEFSVRVSGNTVEETTQIENIKFSLGALNPSEIDSQKNSLGLSCFHKEKCVSSISTCSRKNKDGIVSDCTTANQPRADAFAIQLDGDAAGASRLEKTLRRAIEICREPASVSF